MSKAVNFWETKIEALKTNDGKTNLNDIITNATLTFEDEIEMERRLSQCNWKEIPIGIEYKYINTLTSLQLVEIYTTHLCISYIIYVRVRWGNYYKIDTDIHQVDRQLVLWTHS